MAQLREEGERDRMITRAGPDHQIVESHIALLHFLEQVIRRAHRQAVIKRYAGRVALVHLKDQDPKAPNVLVETQVTREAFVEVGSEALRIPAILAAARAAGVSHYFVEQDATPGDPVDSLKKSYTYLSGK